MGAFFVSALPKGLWLWVAMLLAPAAVQAICTAERVDERVVVAEVVDGDTVRLTDGRRVRLIGINTPEISHDAKPGEPYGEEARTALLNLLQPEMSLLLHHGEEARDRYGRLLAYAFLPDRSSVAARLLAQGLAMSIAIPPNIAYLDCHAQSEQRARTVPHALWAHAYFQPLPTGLLKGDTRGFRFVRGTVRAISTRENAYWLDLGDNVVVRVDRRDLAYFKPVRFGPELVGSELVVRGWLYPNRGKLVIRARHGMALEFLH